MLKVRVRRLMVLLAALLTALTVAVCVALKLVTDVMALRAEDLVQAAAHEPDLRRIADLTTRIEQWSRAADSIAWATGTLVLLSSFAIVAGMYRFMFRPLLNLASSMERFTSGDRETRAETSPAVELSVAADNFNHMADIITGQHARMLDFLSGAAHELKDPMQVMRISLREFAPDKPLPSEPLVRKRLALVEREVDRLERMVETHLDASTVEWKRLDLQQGRRDIRILAQHVAQLYETFSNVHQVRLSVPDKPVCVFADPDRLSQVFHTLVSNAIEYSPRGGIIQMHVAVERDRAVFRVTDHGIGIAEKDIALIFEPFQRVRQQDSPGTPVALSVARRIVEAYV
ncbi:MAG: HAMP domain-containing histidine kinase [Polyangiaceae bacterium]|nr:HAMP domain-containing histidine kinase [Polyangiaceae bacterium]